MLIADGGGGYGGTNWNSHDVRAMWAAIGDHDTDPHFDVVQGWSRTADLTLAHMGQVTQLPGEPGQRVAAVQERGLRGLPRTPGQADRRPAGNPRRGHGELLGLLDGDADSEHRPDEAEADPRAVRGQRGTDPRLAEPAGVRRRPRRAQPSPSPRPTPKPSTPPVSSAQQEQLNNQARAIMFDLSSTVISGQAALKKPKPYNPSR